MPAKAYPRKGSKAWRENTHEGQMASADKAKAGKIATHEPEHTPGPWEVVEVDGYLWVNDGSDPEMPFSPVARIEKRDEETEPNARLIASAPDLLAAAQWALDDEADRLNGKPLCDSMEGLKAAIAKARGGV